MAQSEVGPERITRREFLNYMLGASIGLLSLEAVSAAVWFASPRLNIPQVNLFQLDPASLPAAGSSPVGFPPAQCWLSNTAKGLLALYMVCPARYESFIKWVEVDNRFECPSCGSHFEADGTHIQGYGPARHDLDRFFVVVTTPTGTITTPPSGDPVSIDDATKIQVSTYSRILGKYDDGLPHSPAFVKQSFNGIE